jgi:hydroxyacylglutathione hydrolase
MIHEILSVGPLQCNCSIIGDESTREAIVVDPGADIDDVVATLKQHELTARVIYITHGHIDHIGGAMKLKKLTGAPILMNSGDESQLRLLSMQALWVGMPVPGSVTIDQHVKDLDRVKVGTLVGTVLHTPGHTEGSSCLYFPDEKKSDRR